MHFTSSNFTKYVIRIELVLVAHHLRIVGVAGERWRLLTQALEAIQVGLCGLDEVVDARVEGCLDFGGSFIEGPHARMFFNPFWKVTAERLKIKMHRSYN